VVGGAAARGIRLLVRTRVALLASALGVAALLPGPSAITAWAQPKRAPAGEVPAGGPIAAIRVTGNLRIESTTVRSYMLVQPGSPFDPGRIDASLKTLYATGLFSDVRITRDGDTLVVAVKENPTISRIAFEGNRKINDQDLRAAIQLKQRGVFTPALVQSDRQRILDMYAARGRYSAKVVPKIIRLTQNRVDVVFEIQEGPITLVSRIIFVGNHAFGEGRLREVVDSREQAWYRFLSSSDEYDPERLKYDSELLRRFYLRNGYADFTVTNAVAELTPDRSSFFLTYTVSEGKRYRVSKVVVVNTLRHVDKKLLDNTVDIAAGDWYDGDAVERNVQALTTAVQNRGIGFVQVKPTITRDPKTATLALTFTVGESPRVYVERIDITGNTRTMDKVIRREMRLAEGDAYNETLVRRSKQVLDDLGYFNSVNITQSPGSAADKALLNTAVAEKATGELTIGGGYSTDVGALLNVGLHEKNFIGTGIDAGINAVIAQLESQVSLSVTNPYLFDRNIVGGADIFYVNSNLQYVSEYFERRYGLTLRTGFAYSDHLRQALNYSLVDREVYNVQSTASPYIQAEAGYTLISQVGQTLTLDYRDSTLDPHKGWVTRLGTDVAGGDESFIRAKLDGAYYVPLGSVLGNRDWVLALTAGVGYLWDLSGSTSIVDRFFLGGDNLRGFLDGGAGPHANPPEGATYYADSLGGQFIWTQSSELRFPLPLSPDLGLTGRTFVDIGANSIVPPVYLSNGQKAPLVDIAAPRISTGVGVTWHSPFGLINLDLGIPIVHYLHDQLEVFRVGFGTRF